MSTINIKRRKGVAGEFSLTAETEDGPLTFTGNTYGGPIVMVTPGNPGGTFVSNPKRFGAKLTEQWVRNFVEASA